MNYVRPAIAAMQGYVPGEQPQAGKFIKLNTNENPYPPSPAVVHAIQHAAGQSLARYPDPVATAFRLRAASLLNLDPDWIVCGNGSDDLLTIVTRAMVGQGDSLRFPYPSYILYETLAQIQGAVAQAVRFESDWTLPDSFTSAAPDLKLALLANPNSPSGTMVPSQKVFQIAQQLPCPLLVDEAYVDFAEDNCLALVRQTDKIMVTRSLSKSYALAGLRFGFLVAQPHIVRQLVKVKDSYNCDALSIAGATAAIDDQAWRWANRSQILATRGNLAQGLERLGFQFPPSQANFLWCTHSTRPARDLYERLKAQQVLVRYMDYPGWGDGLRISVGTDEQTEILLALLKDMV